VTHASASGMHVYSNPCILDSGVSSHITGTKQEFVSLNLSRVHPSVKIANGTHSPTLGNGKVQATPSMTLTDVLYVPRFCVSLLSISQFTKHNNCKITFFQLPFEKVNGLVISFLTITLTPLFISLPYHCLLSLYFRSYIKALLVPAWKQAMDEEMEALASRETWELISAPTDVASYRWVFTLKYRPNGSVDTYNARLVAKGYTI